MVPQVLLTFFPCGEGSWDSEAPAGRACAPGHRIQASPAGLTEYGREPAILMTIQERDRLINVKDQLKTSPGDQKGQYCSSTNTKGLFHGAEPILNLCKE